MGGLKTEIVGNKAFFSLSYSEENRSLLATGADRSVRLYDPRATEGNLVIFPKMKTYQLTFLGSKRVHVPHWLVFSSTMGLQPAQSLCVQVWRQLF